MNAVLLILLRGHHERSAADTAEGNHERSAADTAEGAP